MFSKIFTQTYYGNTIGQWLGALAIIIGAFVLGKALYWVFGNVIKKLTEKTKTRLDDLIVDMIEEPIVLVLTIAGVWFGLRTLNLPAKGELWLSRGLHFAIILTTAWLLDRLLDAVYREYLLPMTEKTETDLDDQLLPIVRKGTSLAVWSLGLIVALNNAGYDVGALIAGLGIGGLALAMAAKDTVANVFGGFTLFTDRPFTLKDRVKVAGFEGFVREIGVRSTRIETLAGTLVTLPNSKIADMPVENVSAAPRHKIELNLGLTYDMDPNKMRQAMELLHQIAQETEHVAEDTVLSFNAFGDFAMNIMFVYFIDKDADVFTTQSAMNLAILERFNQEKLEMAFPTQTVYSIAS